MACCLCRYLAIISLNSLNMRIMCLCTMFSLIPNISAVCL